MHGVGSYGKHRSRRGLMHSEVENITDRGSLVQMGFGYFVVYHAVRLTLRVKRFSPFILLVWVRTIMKLGRFPAN